MQRVSNDTGIATDASMRHAVVSEVFKGIKRTKGTAQTVKSPIVIEYLRRMMAAMPPTSLGAIRDRALILVGFAGALRFAFIFWGRH